MIKYAMVSLFATLALSAFADDRRAEESGEGQSAQDRRASSYLYAQMVNADALKSFDVLIRYEAFHDIAPESYIRDEIMLRLRVDFTANKLLAVRRIERRQMEKEVSEDEKRLVLLLGACATDEQTTETNFDGKTKRNSIGMPATMAELELVDVRYVGISSYPRLASRHSTFAQTLAESKAAQGFRITPVNSDRLRISRESLIGNSIDDRGLVEWIFDTTMLVPTSFYSEFSRSVAGKKVRYPRCRESIEWQDADGVIVPVRIVGTELGEERIGGKVVKYEVDKTVQFHWFHVNGKVDDESYSAKLIESYDLAFPLIDEDLFETESVFQLKK